MFIFENEKYLVSFFMTFILYLQNCLFISCLEMSESFELNEVSALNEFLTLVSTYKILKILMFLQKEWRK